MKIYIGNVCLKLSFEGTMLTRVFREAGLPYPGMLTELNSPSEFVEGHKADKRESK